MEEPQGKEALSRLDRLLEEYEEDTAIRQDNLMHQLYSVPILHSKYIGLYARAKRDIAKAVYDMDNIKLLRTRYYNGELPKDVLAQYGWTQYQHNKPMKSALEQLLAADPYVKKMADRVAEIKIYMETLESIMKELGQRGYLLKTIVDLRKFEAGA